VEGQLVYDCDIRPYLINSSQNVLAKGKYYFALGLVVDAALSRILEDILTLPDIPEVESRRLSELCRILNALEGLFVEDPEHVSACEVA
jgi:protein transport protein DSL1/ZW10